MEQKHNRGVIFGIGSWGKELYQIMKNYPWKCFVDSKPSISSYEDLPVVAYSDFIDNYQNKMIFNTLIIYHDEMYL